MLQVTNNVVKLDPTGCIASGDQKTLNSSHCTSQCDCCFANFHIVLISIYIQFISVWFCEWRLVDTS